ncbi:hypothetical protein C1646_774572 [Rhizophagus diaphanus]|nr:hypothetical protein C1646_774572 [Rhizophagus diaphanus] [Rhizophagus sp. MUCL 43196]
MESEFDLLREENTRLMAKITGLESEKAELEARNAELRERVAKLEEKQLENEPVVINLVEGAKAYMLFFDCPANAF